MTIDIKDFLEAQELARPISELVEINELKIGGKMLKIDPIEVSGELYLVDEEVYLNLDFEYTYTDVCDRCLGEFEQKNHAKWSTRVLTEESEETGDELEQFILLADDFLLDLETQVEEAIVFSMPMKAICKSSCKGICPTCGKNLNEGPCSCDKEQVDERFAKLKELFE
ncbi:MAG: DUF177 domain-containing protein [Tissierellales bacterium]|jgi:uncharacterized protein|nr:DUF177 domain-containing protein [Tissierellales bacterium]